MPAATAWPASALSAADTAFRALVCPPHPLALDGRVLGHGLPARPIPLDELRDLLLAERGDDFLLRDAVWRELVHRAQTAGPQWVIGAVGLALPALVRFAADLAVGHRDQAEDLDSEVLAGFLTALRAADPAGERLCATLCWAGFRAGVDARAASREYLLVDDLDRLGSRDPLLPYGHPDLLLARAVALGVVDADDAALIEHTRLAGYPLEELADDAGLSAPMLRMRRLRAERALVAALRAGHLSRVPAPAELARLGERAARRRRRRAHASAVASATITAPAGAVSAAGRRGDRSDRPLTAAWSVPLVSSTVPCDRSDRSLSVDGSVRQH